jgi:antitoxin ParD1/3/4
MTRINVSLPDELKQRLDLQIARRGFADAGQYLRNLIEMDLQEYEDPSLEAQLLEGLKSGRATLMTDRDWTQVRREVARRSSKRRRNAS